MPHILPKTTPLSSPPPSLFKKKKQFLCLTCSLSKIQWRHHAFSKTWMLLWCGKQGPCFLAGTLGVCSDPTAERRLELPGVTDKTEGHRRLHLAHSPQTLPMGSLVDTPPPPPGALLLGPAQLDPHLHGSRWLTAKEMQTIVKEGSKIEGQRN